MNKKIFVLLFMLCILSCLNKIENAGEENMKQNKEKIEKIEKKYISYLDFNDRYNYLWSIENYNSIYQTKTEILKLYLEKVEKEKILLNNKDDNIIDKIFKNYSEEDKVIQQIILINEFLENEYIRHSNYGILNFLDENLRKRYDSNGSDVVRKKLFSILETNFSKEEIKKFLKYYTLNGEFEYHDIWGRYGLPKVDDIIEELEKIEGISEKEWSEREMALYVPLFENEYLELGDVYILKNNRIVIVDENKEITKEIKIKDYKNTDVAMYKGILYIYDDEKIYEYSLKNLDDVNIIDVKELVF